MPLEHDNRPRKKPHARENTAQVEKHGCRDAPNRPGRLHHGGEAAAVKGADKKPAKAQLKAEHSASKLHSARKKLPKKHKVRRAAVTEKKNGKVKNKLRFEEEVKSRTKHSQGSPLTRPVKTGANTAIVQAHGKIYQAEQENVGTQAAHRGETLAGGGLRGAYRHHRAAPYRKVERLEKRTAKLNIRASYQQALRDDPKLKSNAVSRLLQKRKIKKQYAQAAREAKRAGAAVNKAVLTTENLAAKTVAVIKRHPGVIAGLAVSFMAVAAITSVFTAFSGITSGIGSSILAASYVAEDADVDDAELLYTELETDLQMQIGRTESDFPGYDEYRYQVDNIGHNPYELMAYLTAVHHDFRYSIAEAALREIFAEQYSLTVTPVVETRYADPTDANGDGDCEPYEWRVLSVTLTSQSFSAVIFPRMDSDERQHYSLLVRSKGARQYVKSPLDFNWLPRVSSYYGYRVHPTTGEKNYHKGIDISVPTGTDIHAAHDGIVTTGYDAGGYGYYITLTGADGLVTKYAHCSVLIAGSGQSIRAGDVIAKSGNTGRSTGPHLHFELIKNDRCLNPIFFAQSNDNGGGPVYGIPGAPMGDGTYAAMIAEAEKYLGYPYVWGGSSPSTSFDCSGYVCWVINQSGVGSVGRTTAQGLFNLCTPVSPSEARPGDLIFFSGTYSTTDTVTHVGIYVGGDMMLHCGNPIGYVNYVTRYGSHFYSFGRLSG